MSDGAQEGGGRRGGPSSIVGVIFVLLLAVYILQVYLNKPEDRPAAACWAPYRALWVGMVEVPKLALPRDPEVALAGARKAAAFNTRCICFMTRSRMLNTRSNGDRLACE